jgi:rod shape determining protein RodA
VTLRLPPARAAGDRLSRPTVGRSGWQRFVAKFDWPLFVTIALIATIGLINLHSALSGRPHQKLLTTQIGFMTIGVAAYIITTIIDYRFWQRLAWIALGAAIVALGIVEILGFTAKGAQRWLDLGFVTIQPSELAKIAVIMAMARFAQEAEAGELPLVDAGIRTAALRAPVVLVLVQPDLGSATLLLLIILAVTAIVARRLWLLGIEIGVYLAALPLAWDRLHEYQRNRVLAFLDPAADPTGIGWHTRQSVMAVGAGRVTGEGYLEGTQNQFRFLPEQWTDFPFSVWAEEWGFVGCVLLLLLFLFLIVWVLHVATRARDRFGAVLCLGVAAMLFWHTTVNVAMVLGLAPVVGVTLPLISYGGSSLSTIFVGAGLVSSVSARRDGG